MKRILELLAVLFMVFLWAAGCEEEKETPRPIVGEINVTVGEDTLCYSPWDTVGTTVTVVVLSTQDRPMPGVHVNVSLSNSEHATLEYMNPVLGDTTNQYGRIEYIFTPDAPNSNWIRAAVDDLMDSTHIVTAEFAGEPPNFILFVTPDTVHLIPPDSVQVTVRFTNSFNFPIMGFTPDMTVSGGTLDPMPPTDSNGVAFAYWHLADAGFFWIAAEYPWIDVCHDLIGSDTAWVTVLPPPVGQVQILVTDTLRFLSGDTASASVTVIVSGQNGYVLPGKRVLVSVSNPQLGFLEFMDPQLQDTTNEFGRMQLYYHTWAYGANMIVADCEGVSDTATVISVPPGPQ